jgi:hypothetical protein
LTGASAGSDPLPGHVGSGDRTGPHGRAQDSDGPGELLGRVVFALLVLACFAALIVTQRLKHTPTAVQNFEMTRSFSPAGTGVRREERISFKLAKADAVTVTIVNSAEHDVATLVRDLPVPRYKQFSLRWNGRLGAAHGYKVLTSADGHKSLLPSNRGGLAPVGEYSVRVRLSGGRSVLSQRSFKLVAP